MRTMQNTAGGDSDVAQRPETHNYFAMKTKKYLLAREEPQRHISRGVLTTAKTISPRKIRQGEGLAAGNKW